MINHSITYCFLIESVMYALLSRWYFSCLFFFSQSAIPIEVFGVRKLLSKMFRRSWFLSFIHIYICVSYAFDKVFFYFCRCCCCCCYFVVMIHQTNVSWWHAYKNIRYESERPFDLLLLVLPRFFLVFLVILNWMCLLNWLTTIDHNSSINE